MSVQTLWNKGRNVLKCMSTTGLTINFISVRQPAKVLSSPYKAKPPDHGPPQFQMLRDSVKRTLPPGTDDDQQTQKRRQ